MKKLTMNQIGDIEFWGKQMINGDEYTYKEYTYKSEIYKNGILFARIDNCKPVTDDSRVEYVETGWIPVTERLPEMPDPWWHKQDYLVCTKEGVLLMLGWYDGWNCHGEGNGGIVNREHEMHEIVAWMPLPEPYKEG